MGTFADLMSLLMCFFVLLLSFAVMDAEKFKQIAGSMRAAFGVQKEIKAESVPMGTSVVKQEFSPGTPDPTPLDMIRQQSNEDARQAESRAAAMQAQMEEQAEEKAEELKLSMSEEIEDGLVEVETEGSKVIVRINEKGSFSSGSAEMHEDFLPVIDRISAALSTTAGHIVVAGHTDDIPISTERFRSNWDLSSARAVTVLHQMTKDDVVPSERVVVEGHADTRPLVANDSYENRATNRRVEIILEQEPGHEAPDQMQLDYEVESEGFAPVEPDEYAAETQAEETYYDSSGVINLNFDSAAPAERVPSRVEQISGSFGD